MDVLRNVCWLDVSGGTELGKGDYAVLLRAKFAGWAGNAIRTRVSETGGGGGDDSSGGGGGTAAARRIPALQLSQGPFGTDGSAGLDSSHVPRGLWRWVLLGRARVAPTVAAAGVSWQVFDHSNAWKSGLTIDRVAVPPWASLP